MSRGFRRPGPALAVASVALFLALGGAVYAAERIDGKAIKVKSLPGNRLMPNSVSGNRLKAGTVQGSRLAPKSITGTQIDAATLGQVPNAVHADNADSAHDAETALNAVNAVTAEAVGGHRAGCKAGTRPFAGACWQTASSETAATATTAAESCATQGGELPDALTLAAFSMQPQIFLAEGSEWTSDINSFTGVNAFSVATVSVSGDIGGALSTAEKKYRCVIPLLS